MDIIIKTIFSTKTPKEINELTTNALKNLSCDHKLSPKYKFPQIMLCVPMPSFIEGIIEPNKLNNKSILTNVVITSNIKDIIRIVFIINTPIF
jgi:hypothetical protein